MKDVRIGNDISVIWSLYSDQKPFLLDGLRISVYLKGMYGKTKIEDYTIKDNEIHWTFFGKDQKHTGKYSLTLVVNEGAEGMVTTDVCDLVRLVSCTCQADGSDEDGVQTETIAVNSEVELLSGGFGRIDTALDPMSENAVSNAVITAEFVKVNEATSGLKTQMADDKAELMTNLEQVGVLAYEAAMRSSRNEQDKVSKEEGKGLSTNDYTDEDKNKLEGLENYDDTQVKQSIAEVKESIDNINPAPMVSVTYAELVKLRNNGQLIAGMQYRITDYVTTTAQENTHSAGHPFDVIVTADSANKLNEVARAGFPTFNIERYKDAYCSSYGENMAYLGLYEYNGKEYYLYESKDKQLQMLVSFQEDFTNADISDIEAGYIYKAIPSFGRWDYEGTGDVEWLDSEEIGEDIVFKSNPNSAYFHDAEAKLEAWKIWYCLDNDTERFAWADAESGKGVIYRMIDEWNNDLPYDFKNIMFKRYELNAPELYEASGIDYWMQKLSENIRAMFNSECQAFIWSGLYEQDKYWENDYEAVMSTPTGRSRFFYTFSDDSDISFDSSLGGACGNNVMLSSYRLPNNVFFGGGEHYGNRFGTNCYDNSFSFECLNNTFGSDCCENCLGVGCRYNTFGNDSSHNSFGYECQNNNFGNRFNYNSLGDECINNSFGNASECNGLCMGSSFNAFGNGCSYNGFGRDCQYNRLGNYCEYNCVGDNFFYNSFGEFCQSNIFKDASGMAHNVMRSTFENGVSNVEFYFDDTAETYSLLQWHHVYSGVGNCRIELYDGRRYETCYACDKSGNVQEFCIMDFKNS